MKSKTRCSQRDFSLGFKSSVVDLIERRQLIYKKPGISVNSKTEVKHFPSFAVMPGKICQLGDHSLP